MTSVLIADDHAFFRTGLESALEKAGYNVVASVDDGIDALEAVKLTSPDIVILDVRMPRMDGITTLNALRNEGVVKPIVLLAAEFEDAVLADAIRAGASAMVNKSGPDTKLFDALTVVQSGGQFFEPGYLDQALSQVQTRRKAEAPTPFSQRELAIAEAVSIGMKNREISAKQGMSEAMVKPYLHRIYARLGLNNRTELALYMRENGFVT